MRLGGQNRAALARDLVSLEGMIYRMERTAGYLLAAVWGWVGGMWLNQLIQECARRGC